MSGAPVARWASTTLRIKDPVKSIPFYESNFGCKLVDKVDGSGETRYFLARPRDNDAGDYSQEAGSAAAHKRLFARDDANYVELWHTHGVEGREDVVYDSGNNEPKRGFGHLAFSVADVYASCETLEKAGVGFKKKPDEGRMKGLAFVLDPDGYWIEIVKRADDAGFSEEFNLSQTMLRVRDPTRSLAFYTGHLGMRLLCARHFSDFSLYFLMSVPRSDAPLPGAGPERDTHMKRTWRPILELTHNHGTEKDADFAHHNGNTDPKGFSAVGFVTDNLEETCALLRHDGCAFADAATAKELGGVSGKVEVAYDPDGYAVKLIAKGAEL